MAAAGIFRTYMFKFHRAAFICVGFNGMSGGGDSGLHCQHSADALAAGGSLGHSDDEVGQLYQFHQNLAHVIDQRHYFTLGEIAGVYLHCTRVNQGHQRKVDGDVGQRVHESADAARPGLHAGEQVVAAVEGFDFLVLPAKGTQHAHAVQVFPGVEGHVVQLFPAFAVHGHGDEHDAEYDHGQHGDDDGENHCAPGINQEGHNHCAEHDEGGAQEQAQAQVHAGLQLVDIAGHAGNQRGSAQTVQVCVAQALDVGEQRAAQPACQSHRRFGGKELGGYGANQPHQSQPHQDQTLADNGICIARGNALVDDARNHKGHDQFEAGFQQLEQRAQQAFQPVGLQVTEYPFHKITLQGSVGCRGACIFHSCLRRLRSGIHPVSAQFLNELPN